MNSGTLRDLLSMGEGQQLEFKQSLGLGPEIMRGLCALLNSEGGRLLVGVSPDGSIVGVDVGRNTLENLAGDIAKTIDPRRFQ
jgi:ATP-dependent DNA helicase RecG